MTADSCNVMLTRVSHVTVNVRCVMSHFPMFYFKTILNTASLQIQSRLNMLSATKLIGMRLLWRVWILTLGGRGIQRELAATK